MKRISACGSVRRIARTAILAILLACGAALVPHLAAPALAQAQPAAEPVQNEVRAVLTQYGRFVQHPRYGEVWVPTVTPPGWHPYPPCQWVFTEKFGWYFDDKTPWGQIVHHYGRWAHDAQTGWIWVPGAEFSPGWVVWRTSPKWVGWAPTPPDIDMPGISPAVFNSGSDWIFMEVAMMRSGCTPGSIVNAGVVPQLLRETVFVTELEYVDGIVVFVLPPYIVAPFFDIAIGFGPWPPWYLAQLILDLNWLWVNMTTPLMLANACGPAGGPIFVPLGP
jgi:hypothetical protein